VNSDVKTMCSTTAATRVAARCRAATRVAARQRAVCERGLTRHATR